MSTNFQLTENGWYQNEAGDKCKVALLNGVWVAVWDNGNLTEHNPVGQAIFSKFYANLSLIEEHHITAKFEGWLSNPFIGSGKHYEWACAIPDYPMGRIAFSSNEPLFKDEKEGFVCATEFHFVKACTDDFYIGDWRNSLTHREDWQ